jgi:hypothetical protein
VMHDRLSDIQITACIGSPEVGSWNVSTSSPAWYQQLGSQNFVLNDHLMADVGGTDNKRRPGIDATPIDLR